MPEDHFHGKGFLTMRIKHKHLFCESETEDATGCNDESQLVGI